MCMYISIQKGKLYNVIHFAIKGLPQHDNANKCVWSLKIISSNLRFRRERHDEPPEAEEQDAYPMNGREDNNV